MKRFYLISTLLFLMVGQCAFAQREKPEWTNGYFEESAVSYIEVVSAIGYEVADARTKAVNQIIERRSLATGSENKVIINGNDVRVEGSHDLIVKSRIVDEYPERLGPGQYKVYLLVQTAKNPTYTLDPVSVTDKYKFSASAFVPGMAQIKKGNVGKGTFFIIGEIAFVGGIVVAECMRASYINKINSTHNASLRMKYTQNANTCALVRNVCIGGAAAVYVWNVIDGIVAKGKPHVTLGDARMRFAPYTDFESGGLALNIQF